MKIPPESEVVVPGYTWGVIDKSSTGLIEADAKFVARKGLLVAKCLVCLTNGTVPVRIANPYGESCQLYKDTVVASYEPMEPEHLLSMNTIYSEHEPTACSGMDTPSGMDTCSCSMDLPEHIKELFLKSSQCLNTDQQAQRKEMLIKHQSQFSKDSQDLGRTQLVKHQINVIPGTRPIKQHPYRLPIEKRLDAQEQI